jgi:valyl-tRNA synthetase
MTLPDLATKYDPSAIERAIYDRWIEAGVFTAQVDTEREPYVIVIPPPNVTSVLHMGHGLNNTLQDVFIRYRRMTGREALWLPGTDHAGIATQNIVERALASEGRRRQDLGREQFVERVWAHVRETGGSIIDQLKALGCSCDWSRTRFTFDDAYSTAVRRVFVHLHREGLVYRGHRVIHWCPRCLTSLSDEEAEFRERDDHLYYIRYPFVGSGDRDGAVVATTRPETMFGDVCLVYHPDDDRFAGLRGATVEIPLSKVPIPIEQSTAVEREFGTGMLKVTPAHDANDFDIAAALPGDYGTPAIMTDDARMADDPRVPKALRGLDRDEARQRILDLLKAAGLLVKVDPYGHAVRHCYRCHTVVEPRLSDQWFVKMRPLAQPALDAYRDGKLTFVPDRWGKVYEHWLTEIRDWNISRQLWWGHRIPAWYCEADGCDHITVAMEPPGACEQCGGPVRQDDDVLDTWFSSWLWPFATMGWPDRTPDLARFYPGHTLVTGPDIIFFWVARRGGGVVRGRCLAVHDRGRRRGRHRRHHGPHRSGRDVRRRPQLRQQAVECRTAHPVPAGRCPAADRCAGPVRPHPGRSLDPVAMPARGAGGDARVGALPAQRRGQRGLSLRVGRACRLVPRAGEAAAVRVGQGHCGGPSHPGLRVRDVAPTAPSGDAIHYRRAVGAPAW